MERRTVELTIAGQKYRVVSSASEEDLHALASVVSGKMQEMGALARTQPSQALLLAAMALAHDVETERRQRMRLESKTREFLRRVLARIDEMLAGHETGSSHAPPLAERAEGHESVAEGE